jgi:hypothetical protein
MERDETTEGECIALHAAQAARPKRQVQLTERDQQVLRWIGEQTAARADQVGHLLAQQAGPGIQTPGQLSESATHVWRTRMKALGAVKEARGFHNEPSYLWLTGKGLRLAELDYKPLEPALTSFKHLYWCNEVRLFIATRRPEARWIPERELRSEHAQASREKHQAPDIPDALVETRNGVAAVEVELTDKQQSRLARLVRRRANDQRYYTVWYFCSSETRERVNRARAEVPEAQREKIRIYDLPQKRQEKYHDVQQTARAASSADEL